MRLSPLARTLAALIAVMTFASLAAQFAASQLVHAEENALQTLWRLGRFFTILTNVMVAVTFTALALRGVVASARWLGGVTLWIAIVGVVYHLLLAATDSQETVIGYWANIGLHTTVPLAVVAWWLAFGPRTGLNVTAALMWMGWPLVYVCYALGRGQFDGTYPYFFTDPTNIGWMGVAKWTVILALAFVVGGLIQIALARLIRHTDPT
ncbi:Pr6Pr family membrane protein [Pseudooceanicola sp. MF1-13]|uniref:Pr6Pr family membrane protein n=1 Tax=Pseudooceanicola sp. MF1-13 TaxID=3379095 RepID=UPI003891B97B